MSDLGDRERADAPARPTGPARPPVHVVGRFPPPTDGQTLATALAADLLEGTHDVRRHDTQPASGDALGRAEGLDLGRALFFLRRRRSLKAALAEAPAAPVLWHSISPAPLGHARDVLATVPAFAPRQPVVAVLHRSGFGDLFGSPLTAPSARRLVERVDRFVIQSESLAQACAPHVPREKVALIPNTLDAAVLPAPDAVDAAREARLARRGAEPFRLLFLSHLLPTKGYRDVLDAVPILRERGVEVRADFVGGWDADADRRAAEQFVRARGLHDAARFHGVVEDRARARALFLGADALALPTYYPPETQPKAILEALAAGTPVVVTRHASIPEMVRAGREARFVPARSPSAVADAVASLADPAAWRAASVDARARFDAAFAPAAVRDRWLALLSEIAP